MSDFKLPDPKKNAGRVLGLGVLGGLGLLTYSYILPWLNKVVWGTVELMIGAVAVGVIGYILLSPKFWKRTRIILDTFGEILFKGFIEMNPFTILTLQLDKAEKDRNELLEQSKRLKGQEANLAIQITEHKVSMREAAAEMEICKKRLASDPTNEDVQMALESSSVTFVNSKDFVDSVSPILTDIRRLTEFADKAYRKSGNALKNARTTIAMQRAKYEAVTAGSSAMKKALRAFTGDTEMNKAGAIALDKLRIDIANKVGTIKTCLQATSNIMNERDLKDAAKVALAVETADRLNIDATFEYVPTMVDGPDAIQLPGRTNKYLETLKQP
jgi:hypothetical protein